MTTRTKGIEWIKSESRDYWISEWREWDRQWEIIKHANAATLSVRWHPNAPFTRVAERPHVADAQRLATVIEA